MALPAIDLGPRELGEWRPPESMTVSECASRYRILSSQHAAQSGGWNEGLAPYTVEPMNAFADSRVEEITIKAAHQSAKTECVYNMLGWAIDQCPLPALIVMPTIDSLRKSNARIRAMIEDSPRYAGHLLGNRFDLRKKELQLDRMPIYFATAGSTADLRHVVAAIIILDEIDDYRADLKSQGDPIEQAIRRSTTFSFNRKIVRLSTTTVEESNIEQAYAASDGRRLYVPCPHCGTYQTLGFFQIKCTGEKLGEWPAEKRDPEYILEHRVARYECVECHREIDDHHKAHMLKRHKWVPRDNEEEVTADTGPFPYRRHVGYAWSSVYSVWRSFSRLAAMYFGSKGDLNKHRVFVNLELNEPWKEHFARRENNEILEARCDLPALVCPPETVALTCGIDRQMRGFYFVVRAWARDLTSWLVQYGFLAAWEDVETLLFESNYEVRGRDYRLWISRAAIDTGGTLLDDGSGVSMTEDVYVWLRRNGRGRGLCRVWGTKGTSTRPHWKVQKRKSLDKLPSGKPAPGGLTIFHLNTNSLKDVVWYRLDQARKREACGAYLHAETGTDYSSQILAEEKEKKTERWIQIGQRPNHYFDAEVICAALADPEWGDGGIKNVPTRDELQARQKMVQRSQDRDRDSWQRREAYRRPGWLDR